MVVQSILYVHRLPTPCINNENRSVRMLASPIRACLVTRSHLPNGWFCRSFILVIIYIYYADFLVRLVAARMPASRVSSTIRNIIVPDGIEHPRFKSKKSGFGWHVVCRKETIDTLSVRGSYCVSSLSLSHSLYEMRLLDNG